MDVVADIKQTCTPDHDEATVKSTIDLSELQLRTDPVLVSMLLTNLVENAIVHSESSDLTVSITVSEVDTSNDVRFEIRDNNDRIPDQEIETLRAGEETALQHGQGIGLWIVYWVYGSYKERSISSTTTGTSSRSGFHR